MGLKGLSLWAKVTVVYIVIWKIVHCSFKYFEQFLLGLQGTRNCSYLHVCPFFDSQKITEGLATSSTGGWCGKVSVENGGKHMTDRKIVPALVKIFEGKQ